MNSRRRRRRRIDVGCPERCKMRVVERKGKSRTVELTGQDRAEQGREGERKGRREGGKTWLSTRGEKGKLNHCKPAGPQAHKAQSLSPSVLFNPPTCSTVL